MAMEMCIFFIKYIHVDSLLLKYIRIKITLAL